MVDAVAERPRRWMDFLHIGAIAAVASLIYLPSMTNPLRAWDHHVILLLAKAPQFAPGLFWYLVHYRIGFGDEPVYFRVLYVPLTYALARVFQDHSWLYYGTHLLLHVGVAVVLYYLVVELSDARTLAALMAILFAVYSGSGDTVNLPAYSFMLVSELVGGLGVLLFLKHLRTRNITYFVVGVSCVTVATLFYDSFLLLAIALPVLAVLIALKEGTASRRYVRTAAGLLAGVAVVFALVIISLNLSPFVNARPQGGIGLSLRTTAGWVLGHGRTLTAMLYGGEALAADVQVFLTGHFPGVWHRGNIPYWDLRALRQLWWKLHLALGLMAGGIGCLRLLKGGARGIGVVLLAAGAFVDVRTVALAILGGAALLSGWRRLLDARGLVIVAAGFLVSLNIALGRGGGYNVMAFRHHYMTGFFVIAGLAALLGANWSRHPVWRQWSLMAVLGVCIVANAWVTVRILEGVKKDNQMVFSFDDGLTTMLERHGPQSLFVSFSPSFIKGDDWRDFPLQDVAFDILHYHANPMTRYANRAPFIVMKDRVVRPNPAYRQPGEGDFLFRFRLMGWPPGPHELFGSSPREPRIILDRGGVVLRARRRADDAPVEWKFAIPQAVTLPALVTISQSGRSLQVTANDTVIARAVIPDHDASWGWESDNAGLLGRGFERLVASGLVFDTYMRIGTAVGDEI